MMALALLVIPLLSFGFADYLLHFVEGFNRMAVALAVVVTFIVINYFGMKSASGSQNILVVFFIAAILLFGIGGLLNADFSLLSPLAPQWLESGNCRRHDDLFFHTAVPMSSPRWPARSRTRDAPFRWPS